MSNRLALPCRSFACLVGFVPQYGAALENVLDLSTVPFTVLRLVTPFKMSYEAAKKRAELYTNIFGELPDIRRNTVELVNKAVKNNWKAYVFGQQSQRRE